MENTTAKSLREQLNGMFSRYNFVGIKNILDEEFSWPVALEQNEILNMSQADSQNEQDWVKNESGKFLPGDGPIRGSRVVKYTLQPGETKMVIGEAAYVLIDKIFSAYVKSKHVPKIEVGSNEMKQQEVRAKKGMAKLRNPTVQKEVLKMIIVGPVVNDVEKAMGTFVSGMGSKMNGFTDVQAEPGGKKKQTA